MTSTLNGDYYKAPYDVKITVEFKDNYYRTYIQPLNASGQVITTYTDGAPGNTDPENWVYFSGLSKANGHVLAAVSYVPDAGYNKLPDLRNMGYFKNVKLTDNKIWHNSNLNSSGYNFYGTCPQTRASYAYNNDCVDYSVSSSSNQDTVNIFYNRAYTE